MAKSKAPGLRIVPEPPEPDPDAPADVAHLRPETVEWIESVAADYDLDGHHRRLLILAGEAWERSIKAREVLAEHGLTFRDRWAQPKERPENSIASRSANDFRLLIRELGLDLPHPDGHRPPRIGGT
jgi:phage terminase small subunit